MLYTLNPELALKKLLKIYCGCSLSTSWNMEWKREVVKQASWLTDGTHRNFIYLGLRCMSVCMCNNSDNWYFLYVLAISISCGAHNRGGQSKNFIHPPLHQTGRAVYPLMCTWLASYPGSRMGEWEPGTDGSQISAMHSTNILRHNDTDWYLDWVWHSDNNNFVVQFYMIVIKEFVPAQILVCSESQSASCGQGLQPSCRLTVASITPRW